MPSDSIHDPLVWKPAYKAAAYWLGVWWVFWACLPVGSLSSIYPALIQDYNMTPVDISRVMGWNGLVLALVGFVLLPCAAAYGRRPMILVSNLVSKFSASASDEAFPSLFSLAAIAGLIWITQTHTHRKFLWARMVYAIGAGAIEFLGLCLAGDLFFTQEAGFWHAIGFASLILASNVGAPILGAFEQRNHGWRNFFWFSAGILIFTQILLFLFFPETLWHRTSASARGQVVSSDASVSTSDRDLETTSQNDEKPDKSPDSPASTDMSPATGLSTAQAAIIANVGKGFPSNAQRYSIFPPRNKHYSILQNMLDMLVLGSFGPVILFTIWWTAVCGLLISTGFVASAIWAAPPYNFGPAAVGCTNIPPTIGIFLGFFIAGPVVDWDVAQQAKRNGGVREPEMRLRLAIAGGIVAVVGLVLYGLGLERQWHWAAILVPGIGLNQFASAFSVVAVSSYATDVYKQYALEIGFITTLFKNSWVFGLGYFMNDLYVRVGPLKMTVLISIPLYAAMLLTVLFLFIGKATRRFSAKFAVMQRD